MVTLCATQFFIGCRHYEGTRLCLEVWGREKKFFGGREIYEKIEKFFTFFERVFS